MLVYLLKFPKPLEPALSPIVVHIWQCAMVDLMMLGLAVAPNGCNKGHPNVCGGYVF